MKEIAVVLSDDMDWMEKRERVPADETVTLALDGTVVELDLTAGHAAELRVQLEPWLEAGHAPEGAHPDYARTPRKKGQFAPGVLDYKRGLREWAEENRLRSRSRKGLDRPAYMTTTGKYTYPKWLRDAYEEHLRGGGIPGGR